MADDEDAAKKQEEFQKRKQEFFARDDLAALSRRGVATPDHVIRTKNYPLHLTAEILAGGRESVTRAVEDFIVEYTAYFDTNAARFGGAKTMLMPTPNLAWIEGVGAVGISANAKAAAAASDRQRKTSPR